MTAFPSVLHLLTALTLSPLLLGIVNRVKARFAGRQGQHLLQPYYDIFKLLRKGAVYSRSTSWIFRAGPTIGLAAVLIALTMLPLGTIPALRPFSGDLIVLAYLLGLMRFMTVIAALDTGSAFEGMGASREVQFSLLAEPALLLSLAALAICTGRDDLSAVLRYFYAFDLASMFPTAVLAVAPLLIVLLVENARIPVDDPNTHLELTMIHEVMVLDHSGVDLAFIHYAASLKLWIFSALLTGIAMPVRTGDPFQDMALGLAGMFCVAVLVGVIESSMARLRLVRVPLLLVVAVVLASFALLWALR